MLEEHYIIDESVIYEAVEKEEKKPAQKLSKQGHFDHLEDLLFRGGEKGYNDAMSVLGKTYDFTKGRNRGINISTKFDGSPGILWGHLDGKFFVSTKSFFNQTPKINTSDADIDTHHGKSKGLNSRLKSALKHLKEITPKKGIFRGDLMYTKDDIEQSNGNIKFTPNTLSYNVRSDSDEGQKILNSDIGIVPHMEYEEQPNGELRAKFGNVAGKFKKSDKVHVIDPDLKGPFEMSPEKEKDYAEHSGNAQKMKAILDKTRAFKAIEGHEATLLGYINHCVKEGKPKSVAGYISFLTKEADKHIGKVKKDDTKSRAKQALDDEIFKINQNKEGIDALFKTHSHISKAKQALTDTLGKGSPYRETVLDKPAKPEGFVASVNGQPVKLVDRNSFSAANFEWNNKVNPEDNPLVLTYGRMNPATTGHEKLIKKAEDIARRTGAKDKTVLTNSQDKKTDPLTPADKLKWAKTLFPGKDISLASPDKGTLLAQLQHHHNSGVKDLTVVTGSDQAEKYKQLINKYNGTGKHCLFNFKRARVVVADRDADGKGVEGVSATKMRDHAANDDYNAFKSMVPKHVQEKSVKDIYHTLRAAQGVVEINDKTPGEALAIYAKRKDDIGHQSKAEIEKRKKDGKWTGHVYEQTTVDHRLFATNSLFKTYQNDTPGQGGAFKYRGRDKVIQAIKRTMKKQPDNQKHTVV